MNCKYFTIRSKQYKKYYFCKLNKKEINFDDCKYCNNKEFKKYKSIKAVSKKENVSQKTYNKVYERDEGKCRICGNYKIQLHHILYRSERKDLINDIDNCIMLCESCHRLVHSNKKKWQPKLIEMIERNIRRK